MNSALVYFFLVSAALVSLVIVTGSYFTIWGSVSFFLAIIACKFSRRLNVNAIIPFAIITSFLNFLLHIIVFLLVYREGDFTLFGVYGDDYRYLNTMRGSGDADRFNEFGIGSYLSFPFMLKILYSIGGIWIVLALGWLFFMTTASLLSWNLYKLYQDRSYLQGLVFLTFFPDIYIWAGSLYKEIWVAAAGLLFLTVISRPQGGLFGLFALSFFRFAYIIPFSAALAVSMFGTINRSKVLLSLGFFSVILLAVLYAFWSDILIYYQIFFSENRIASIMERTGVSSISQLFVLVAVLVPASPIIALATPLPIYFEKVDVYDNLWWMTTASGAFLAYLIPWIFSYRKKDLLLYAFFALAAFLTLSFLFLTNRHRFIISVLAIYLGGVMLSKRSVPLAWSYTATFVVFAVQFVVLTIRGQI